MLSLDNVVQFIVTSPLAHAVSKCFAAGKGLSGLGLGIFNPFSL